MDIKALDKVFSEWIRKRDADEYGRVKCCTCPSVAHWSEMDCGHWMGRSSMSTRFDERNSHVQCRSCNRHMDGMYHEHRDYIVERYGKSTCSELYGLSHRELKLMQHEVDELTESFKQKIKDLEQ